MLMTVASVWEQERESNVAMCGELARPYRNRIYSVIKSCKKYELHWIDNAIKCETVAFLLLFSWSEFIFFRFLSHAHRIYTHSLDLFRCITLLLSPSLSLSLPLLILCFSFSRMLNLVVSRKNIHWLLFCLLHFVPPRAFRGFHFILLHFWFVFDSLFLLIAAAALTFAPLFVRQNATFHLLTLCSAHTHPYSIWSLRWLFIITNSFVHCPVGNESSMHVLERKTLYLNCRFTLYTSHFRSSEFGVGFDCVYLFHDLMSLSHAHTCMQKPYMDVAVAVAVTPNAFINCELWLRLHHHILCLLYHTHQANQIYTSQTKSKPRTKRIQSYSLGVCTLGLSNPKNPKKSQAPREITKKGWLIENKRRNMIIYK